MNGILYTLLTVLTVAGSAALFDTRLWVQLAGTALLCAAAASAAVVAAGRSGRWRAPWPRLGGRPPGLVTFCGRSQELRALTERYWELRQPGASNGAIILAIHGMPGVGKSTLAQALARELAGEFPGGQLYANLGNAGSIRAEADILNRFLTALRPGEKLPPFTVERAARFRSLTASAKVLVVLDAARDHQQVSRLLPTGEECAVIVTSRRDLGPALGVQSYLLHAPDMDGALEILRAVSNTIPDEDPKFAIEIVDRVGRLPLAIRAVGDTVVEQTGSLRPAARRLREPGLLGAHGRATEERIDSEYARLTTDERRAFRLLSLVKTPSFVPWVLAPLLGLDAIRHGDDQVEVEKIVSRLAERQLLESAGLDQVTGLDRYQFHPVVRAFAEKRHKLEGDETEAALRRVDEAYLEAIDLILTEIDSSYREQNPRPEQLTWFPEPSSMLRLIANLPDRWVRAEYRNLLRCVAAAYRVERYAMCWRIAARLGDCVPDDGSRQAVLDALDLAQDAAARLADQRAMVEVLLARGGYLGRLGGYRDGQPSDGPRGRAAGHREAFDALAEAARIANSLRSGPSAVNGMHLESEAYRRLAEAHLRAAAYRDAACELDRAVRLAERSGDKKQLALVQLMRVPLLDRYPSVNLQIADDELAFWHAWAQVELARRARRWTDAVEGLWALGRQFDDDASRTCIILLRLAELRLDQLRLDPDQDPEGVQLRAVQRAAEAVYLFQHMHDQVGATRARCVFVRALLARGRVSEAQEQYGYAVSDAEKLEALVFHERSPLRAMLWWAEGELLCAQGLRPEGVSALVCAARVFRSHGDQASEAAVLAAAELDGLPPEAFDPGPPGREPAVTMDDGPLRAGVPFEVSFTIGTPALTADVPPAGGRYLDVLLVAGDAEVVPTVRQARLDAWAPLEPQRFQVTPRREGSLAMRILVYATDDGSLLQQLELAPQHVRRATGSAAA